MSRTDLSLGKAKPFITVEDVTLRLGDGGLLGRFRWEIRSGQHWAVIGPNGSGKTTLMKALCGRTPVATGRIVYHFAENGTSRRAMGQAIRPQDQIAYVTFEAQKTVLGDQHPFHQARWNRGAHEQTMSVSEYLSEHRITQINPYQVVEGNLGLPGFAARRERFIDMLDLEVLLDRELVQVSNGERRKVQLARALLKDPRLLILDNPFTGLDVEFRQRLKGLIGGLLISDLQVILVVHGEDDIPPGITHILRLGRKEDSAQDPGDAIRISHGYTSSPGESVARSVSEQETAWLPAAGSVWPDRQTRSERADGQILIRMKDVSIAYAGVQVLEHVDWTVRQGEHWALLGHNGAGKTTLLSLVLGDNPQAYANEITLFGRRRGSGESIWEIKRHIGWVAPELHLYYPVGIPCRNVVQSGFFDTVGHYRRCTSQQQEVAAWWMDRFGVLAYESTPFHEVSEGEQRLILIARALVKAPELLVLDEPCQGLDAHNRAQVRRAVESAGEHLDASVIYVTHRPDTLPTLITHVLQLDSGRVVSNGRVRHASKKGSRESRGD